MAERKIVIIGGGAIGLSVAYHLGRRGAADVVLLERNRLTSGTSWHAAGICGPLRSSYNLTVLARYGVELFARLEAETGQATGYRQTGGMWLAQDAARIIEFQRMKALADMHGLHASLLSPGQARERFPLLNANGLAGALWVDEDGQVNPVDLCMAYARGARMAGVTLREGAGVAALEKHGSGIVAVTLDDGERIQTERVINCAGLWADPVGRMAGVALPLRAVEHMYVVTEPVTGLPDPCPVIRDLDSGIYLKGDAGRLVLGQFEGNARIWQPASRDPGEDFLEFPEDWDHAEPMLSAGIERVPVLARLGITRFMNGPESFTPDTRQLMGRIPGFSNFYVAAGFNSIGIMSSAGVGRVMADWVVDGEPPMDLWDVDVQRMLPGDADDGFLAERIPEAVHNQFAMHWPYKQYRTGRDRRRSPWHDLMAERGAVFGAPTGWERPLWFAATPAEAEVACSHDAQGWWPAAAREATRLARAGALFDLSPFSKFDVSGPGAGEALQRLCSNRIDIPPGRLVYTLMLNPNGGIEADATVTRTGEVSWRIVTGAATRVRDLDRLRQLLPPEVDVIDRTDAEAVLGVMGPNSRDAMAAVLDDPAVLATLRYGGAGEVTVRGIPMRIARISYVGEYGYELSLPVEGAERVLQVLLTAADRYDMGMAGLHCLDACRLEKGFVHWGHDIGPDDDPVSAGLLFAVRCDDDFDFIGRDAVRRLRQFPPQTRRLLFEVHGASPLLLHDEPVFHHGRRIGRTTSGGLGFRTGKALCMGYVTLDAAAEDGWEIEVAGETLAMTPLQAPPYDPGGSRMKS